MKRLSATIVGVAALVVACVAYSPLAVANPACPFDMNTQAGRDAFMQAIVASSQQVGSHQQEYRATGNPDVMANDNQIARDSSEMTLACQGIAAPPLPPLPQEQPMPPVPAPVEGPPGMDCEGMYHSINSPGEIAGAIADGSARMPGVKIPGLSQIQAAPQAVCAAVNAGVGAVAPNPYNQEQAAVGACNAVNAFINPLPVDMCGNTPAG